MGFRSFLSRHKVSVLIALLALVALMAWLFVPRAPKLPAYESTEVARGDVVEAVNVTGHAEPLERIELAFPTSGRLAQVYVEEGDTVSPGAPIAVLETNVEGARLAEYRARIEREAALLQDAEAGASDEEIAVADSSYERADELVLRAGAGLMGAIRRAYTVADDTLRNKVDKVYSDVRAQDNRFGTAFERGTTKYFIRADSETTSRLTSGRSDARKATEELDALASTISTDLTASAREAESALARIQDFLAELAVVVHGYIPSDSEAQTVYASYQADIAAARTALLAAEDAVRAAHTEYVSADASLTVAERDSARTSAPVRPYAREAQVAALRAAEAALSTQEVLLGEAVLRSPIAGTVTRLERSRGETVAPGVLVAEVFAPGRYEIVAYVPEADIASVSLGDSARVTFDAFEPTDIFSAEVVRIAVGETVREGVPTYKTTLVLADMDDPRFVLRAGMSADVTIEANSRMGVLNVPSRSVLRDGSRTYVRVVKDTSFEERDVELGLRGSEGTTEIVSGLTEGEKIVLFVEDE